MKTIKQIISDADPRLKGVLVIMVVYVMVMATTVTSGATQEIKGYKETIEIQYQDGGQETKDYLVRQDTVKNVLKELDVNLNAKDTVNKDMSYIVQSKDLLQVNRINEEEVEEIFQWVWANEGKQIHVDLEAMTVTVGDKVYHFELDEFRRHCLLNGLDNIGLTLQHEDAISKYEKNIPAFLR